MSKDYYDKVLQRWDHPTGFDSNANFAGYKPTGYVIYSRNRDSSILEETNFAAILDDLGGEGDSVRVIRHGHWACGWIEYITVDDTAPDALLDRCVEIAKALADYPVYSDDRYSEAQWKAIADYWEWLNLRERVELCRDNNVSIFAARRSSVPDQVYQDLSDSTFV
jgi:hypothetical protein